MTKSMQINLKAGERLFLNGAVIKVDRKVRIELLNNAAFLLEAHVLQVEDTTTPLRQLYFTLQTLLIDPPSTAAALAVYARQMACLPRAFETAEILTALPAIDEAVQRGRAFDALRLIRALFPLEDEILRGRPLVDTARASVTETALEASL